MRMCARMSMRVRRMVRVCVRMRMGEDEGL